MTTIKLLGTLLASPPFLFIDFVFNEHLYPMEDGDSTDLLSQCTQLLLWDFITLAEYRFSRVRLVKYKFSRLWMGAWIRVFHFRSSVRGMEWKKK